MRHSKKGETGAEKEKHDRNDRVFLAGRTGLEPVFRKLRNMLDSLKKREMINGDKEKPHSHKSAPVVTKTPNSSLYGHRMGNASEG